MAHHARVADCPVMRIATGAENASIIEGFIYGVLSVPIPIRKIARTHQLQNLIGSSSEKH